MRIAVTTILVAGFLAGRLAWSQNTPKAALKQRAPHAAHTVIGAASFTKEGLLQRPTGYRRWVFVGSPVTPHDMNDGKAPFPEFHNVYIDNESYDAFLKTGEYREGTVLVKELVSVGGKSASSGKGYFQGEFIGLEAVVKSAKQFPNEPGHWAFFSFTAEEGKPEVKTAKAFPTASCNECHSGAQDDYVFSEYYPVLRAAMAEAMQAKSNN